MMRSRISLSRAAVEARLGEIRSQAIKLVKDRANLLAMVDAAREKAAANVRASGLARVGSELQSIFDLLVSYGKRRYRESDWRSIVLAAAAVIYFLNPFDMVPDFLLGGLIDDGVVIGWVVKMISDEMRAFRAWQASPEAKKARKKKRRVARKKS